MTPLSTFSGIGFSSDGICLQFCLWRELSQTVVERTLGNAPPLAMVLSAIWSCPTPTFDECTLVSKDFRVLDLDDSVRRELSDRWRVT